MAELTDLQCNAIDGLARELANLARNSLAPNGLPDTISALVTVMGTAFSYAVVVAIREGGDADVARSLAHQTIDEGVTTILRSMGSEH